MNKVTSTRIAWIDICRGIGILLVLYAHVLASDKNRFLIYAFHMPLFFFLSGIVFRNKDTGFISIVKKNVKAILIPYFIFAFLTYFLGLLLMPHPALTFEMISKEVHGIIFGSANKGYLAFNTALWFLPCLFVTKVSFAFLTHFIRNKKIIAVLLIFFAVIAYLGSLFFRDVKLVFESEIALTGIVFFGAGYLLSQNEKLKTIMRKRKVGLLLITGTLLVLFSAINFQLYGSQIDMRVNRLNDFYLFYLAAFSGIATTILLSMLIKKNILLEYVGKNSILLLGWHTLLFAYFKHISFLPPVQLEFLTPTLHLTFATAIILLVRVFLIKSKAALSFQKK